MGIWEDGADRTDINSLDRSRRGAPVWDRAQGVVLPKTDPESAEWTQGGGYLVTAEDTSLVKMFNYPVVQVESSPRPHAGPFQSVYRVSTASPPFSINCRARASQWVQLSEPQVMRRRTTRRTAATAATHRT